MRLSNCPHQFLPDLRVCVLGVRRIGKSRIAVNYKPKVLLETRINLRRACLCSRGESHEDDAENDREFLHMFFVQPTPTVSSKGQGCPDRFYLVLSGQPCYINHLFSIWGIPQRYRQGETAPWHQYQEI